MIAQKLSLFHASFALIAEDNSLAVALLRPPLAQLVGSNSRIYYYALFFSFLRHCTLVYLRVAIDEKRFPTSAHHPAETDIAYGAGSCLTRLCIERAIETEAFLGLDAASSASMRK